MDYKFTIITIPEIIKEDGYIYCGKCGTKLLIAYPSEIWQVDSEPFKSDEAKQDDCPDEVCIGEITGHFCQTCEQLTSISYNV